MKLFDEQGKWIFLAQDPRSGVGGKGKRAEYLNALKNVVIDTQALAPDLASLEYTYDENAKKRIIARIELIKQQLDLIKIHL